MKNKIRIVEVGLRDGLQNEPEILSTQFKVWFAKQLVEAGLKNIELGAFVSPKWVPQMADSKKVIQSVLKWHKAQSVKTGQKLNMSKVNFSALVPNLKGYERAIKTDLKEIAIFGAASESFSKSNINCSIKESLDRFQHIIELSKKNKIKVRAYLSTVFGCPFEKKVSQKKVVDLTSKLLKMGAYEVSLGDTIGVAYPGQVKKIIAALEKKVDLKKIAMHFHDTRGMALANVLVSLDLGIRVFDSSFGGLGGCPYAPAATGNVATEDLVNLLENEGYKTGVKLENLIKINAKVSSQVGRKLPSRIGVAGLF